LILTDKLKTLLVNKEILTLKELKFAIEFK